MLIRSIIQNEYERNAQMISEYDALIDALPKGTLVCKKNGYYYLKYRDGDKVRDKYIGKDSTIVEQVRTQIALRKHYSDMMTALLREQKAIQNIMEELK